MRQARLLAALAVAAMGVAVTLVAPVGGRSLLALGDLVVGLSLVAAAVSVWPYAPRLGWLVVAAAFAWFAGTLAGVEDPLLAAVGSEVLYLHRALIVAALFASVAALRSEPLAAGTVVAAAIVAIPDVAASGWPVAVLAAVTLLVGMRLSVPRAALAFVVAMLMLGAAAALVALGATATAVVVLAYDVTVLAAGAALAIDLRARSGTRLTDAAVELGAKAPISAALAEAAGDPRLEVVAAGTPLPDDGRVATPIEADGRVEALVLHSSGALADERTRASVLAAARLALAHARLAAGVQRTVDDLQASTRRLVGTATAARARLQYELRDGPQGRLDRIGAGLPDLLGGRLDEARRELADFGAGLFPRALAERGLGAALATLAERAPVAVDLDVMPTVAEATGEPSDVELTAYFVCAEALTNVAKHAHAGRASISVRDLPSALELEVCDDGVGGARPSGGTGLRGLGDRVVALGGELWIDSAPGHGTRVRVSLPRAAAGGQTTSSVSAAAVSSRLERNATAGRDLSWRR